MTGRLILGLDPGLSITGYGLVESAGRRVRLVEAGVLRSSRSLSLPERLARLHESLLELLTEHPPAAVAIEELFSHYERPRTAILMGHARGALMLAAALKGIPVTNYLPTQVKKTLTGNGHADKAQMMQAIQLEFRKQKPIEIPDVADALAVAICHHHATMASSETG